MAQAILTEPVVAGNPVITVEALTPILYKDVPVLTTALLSAVYGTTQTRIRENYRVNRDRFTEGKHLFKVSGDELRALKECVRNSDSSGLVPKTGGELTLWTERGAARHAKMLNTDKAWDVFELLEESYFNRQPANPAPSGFQICGGIMAIYPAFFETGEGGHVVVSFPDLPGCFTQGDTEVEAMAVAIDALSGHVHTLRNLGREVPNPSPLSSLTVPGSARVALVPGPAEETPPVRINVSINGGLLRDIDTFAKREGMTRSGFLAAAAKRLISELQA